MKRTSYPRFLARAAMTLLAVFCCLTGARAQETVEIGSLDGAGNNSFLPMNSLYEYSYTQQIYTAEEIGMAGTINSITMYLYGNENLYEMPFAIYMVETDKEAFASTTDWVSVSESDIVYTGTVTVHNTAAEAYTFELDTPFEYSGEGNLLIAFNNKTGQWKSGLNGMVFGASSDPARAIYARQDNNGYDPTNPTFTATSTTYSRNVIQLEITPSSGSGCERPTNLVAAVIDAHSATLTWESETNAYNIEYKKASLPNDDENWTSIEEDIERNEFTLTDLEQNTAYNARVRAVCDSEEGVYSGWRTVNFTTPVSCPAPTGVNVSNVTAHSATIGWDAVEGVNYVCALVKTADYNPETIELMPQENPAIFSNLDPETPYTFALRKECGGEDGVSQIVTTAFTTTIACPAPTGLTATLTPGNGTVATLSWTEPGDAGEWILEYSTAEDFTGATSVTVNDTPSANLTSLTAETTYYARVKANCGGEDGESQWSSTITFTPTDAYSITVNDGTNTNSYVPVYGMWVDSHSKSQFIIPADALADMAYGTINKLTFYASQANVNWGAAEFEVYMTEVGNTTFSEATLVDWTSMDKVMNAGSLAIVGNKMEITLDAPYQYLGGNLLIGILQPTSGTYSSSYWYGVTTEDNVAIGGYESSKALGLQKFLPKTTFDFTPGEAPTCTKPKKLAVNYIEGTTATVTWEGEATSYNIDVNGTVTNNVTSPYTLNNLTLDTEYSVMVQAACSDTDQSEWTNAVTFTTDACMPEDMIVVNYTLSDSYGDGWNGNYILVVDENCNVVETLTIESGSSATGTVKVCGSVAQFMWYPGKYASETSWSFTDAEGNVLFEGTGNANMQALDLLYSIDLNPYSVPTDITVSEVGPYTAAVAWTETGTATAWQIAIYNNAENELINTVDANSNPFTITGLDPETDYYVTVRAVGPNGTSNWSCLGAEFTTAVACPAPQDIVVSKITATSALVSWLGFSDSYDLRYYALPSTSSRGLSSSINKKPAKIGLNSNSSLGNLSFASSNSKPAIVSDVKGVQHNRDGWYYYDNGVNEDGAIGTGGGEFYWGIMIPAGSYLETTLTKTSVYDYMAMTGTVTIYNDGTDAPAGDALAQAEVTLTGSGDFVETLFEPVTIDPSKNLWIVYYNGSGATYPAAYCTTQSDANGRWVSVDGASWDDVASLVEGCGNFMVRAYLQGEIDVEWVEVNGITESEYELTGLDPETTYFVQIRSNCGEEGQSNYASTNFTTLDLNANPYDLEVAEVTATSATLDWTGSQESYNVKYRKALEIDPTAPATIILTAPSLWDDGSGYQMLLDADATAYGTIIPETGGLTSSGDASAETYAEFEYKIPENADGALTTENVVVNNSVSIEIPAGTYDWCITNPSPDDRVWIAASNGNVGGRYDDFVFEPGVTYEFTLSMYGSNDGVDLTETRPMGEWITLENVTNPYELTGLDSDTYYEWQVQGIYEGDPTEWSEIATFTTLPLIVLANDDSNNEKKNSEIIADYDGETVDVTLAGRTLVKDGNWNTICLPFDLTLEGSLLEDATAKELTNATMTGTHVTLTFGAVEELKAGVPYIIKWENPTSDNLSEPTFTGVTIKDVPEANRTISLADGNVKFIGYYDAFDITPADENIYYMTAGNELKHTGKDRTLKACRAYFDFSESAVRGFTLNFGDSEATGIVSIDNEQLNNESGWYTVDGKKLDKQPKRKGVYINNGIKVVIK